MELYKNQKLRRKKGKRTVQRHRWKRRSRTWWGRDSGLGIAVPWRRAWHSTLCSAFFLQISLHSLSPDSDPRKDRSSVDSDSDTDLVREQNFGYGISDREIGCWIACVGRERSFWISVSVCQKCTNIFHSNKFTLSFFVLCFLVIYSWFFFITIFSLIWCYEINEFEFILTCWRREKVTNIIYVISYTIEEKELL